MSHFGEGVEYKNETPNDFTWWEKRFNRGLFYAFNLLVSLKSKEKFATSVLESIYLNSYVIFILSIIFVMCLLNKTIKKMGSTWLFV